MYLILILKWSGNCSRQGTVSNGPVDVLRERGIQVIRRVQPAGSPARYEDRVGDHCHHMICRTCGAMRDVGDTPYLTASDDRGFAMAEAEVMYWGSCVSCQ
jgi:Fur family transcriptional regulator, stress-responsive regulator